MGKGANWQHVLEIRPGTGPAVAVGQVVAVQAHASLLLVWFEEGPASCPAPHPHPEPDPPKIQPQPLNKTQEPGQQAM